MCLFGTVLHMWEVNSARCAPHAGTVTLQCANVCTRWHYGTYDSVAVVDFHFGRQTRAPLTQVMITNCSFSPSWCSYYHKELHSHLFINSSSFFSLKLGAQCSCFGWDNWKWNVAESTQLEWCRTHKFSVFRPLQHDRWEKKRDYFKGSSELSTSALPNRWKQEGGITRRRYIRRESSQKEHVFVTDHIVNKMG